MNASNCGCTFDSSIRASDPRSGPAGPAASRRLVLLGFGMAVEIYRARAVLLGALDGHDHTKLTLPPWRGLLDGFLRSQGIERVEGVCEWMGDGSRVPEAESLAVSALGLAAHSACSCPAPSCRYRSKSCRLFRDPAAQSADAASTHGDSLASPPPTTGTRASEVCRSSRPSLLFAQQRLLLSRPPACPPPAFA